MLAVVYVMLGADYVYLFTDTCCCYMLLMLQFLKGDVTLHIFKIRGVQLVDCLGVGSESAQHSLLCRYFMLGGAVIILGLGLPSRPDTSMMTWAKQQAKKELDAEA